MPGQTLFIGDKYLGFYMDKYGIHVCLYVYICTYVCMCMYACIYICIRGGFRKLAIERCIPLLATSRSLYIINALKHIDSCIKYHSYILQLILKRSYTHHALCFKFIYILLASFRNSL